MENAHRQLSFVFALAGLLLPVSGRAEEMVAVPAPVMAVWAIAWNASADKVVTGLIEKLSDEASSQIPVEKRFAFLQELKQILEEGLSWETLGRAETQKILNRECGTELLNQVAPFFAAGQSMDEMPKSINDEYVDCAIDADLYVGTTPAYAMVQIVQDNLPELYRRHGIDPKDW